MKRPESAKQALRTRIEKLNENQIDNRKQYLLLCASELASPEVIKLGGAAAEHCAALFILRCLQMDSETQVNVMADWTPEEKDYLLQILFDSQK